MDIIVEKVIEFLSHPSKTGITSVSSTLLGTIMTQMHFGSLEFANVALQHTAWIIGIIAGGITIINGINRFKRDRKNNKIKN